MKRLPIDEAAQRVANWFHATFAVIQILARACGKSNPGAPGTSNRKTSAR